MDAIGNIETSLSPIASFEEWENKPEHEVPVLIGVNRHRSKISPFDLKY